MHILIEMDELGVTLFKWILSPLLKRNIFQMERNFSFSSTCIICDIQNEYTGLSDGWVG